MEGYPPSLRELKKQVATAEAFISYLVNLRWL
jgi:hypothetical protein